MAVTSFYLKFHVTNKPDKIHDTVLEASVEIMINLSHRLYYSSQPFLHLQQLIVQV